MGLLRIELPWETPRHQLGYAIPSQRCGERLGRVSAESTAVRYSLGHESRGQLICIHEIQVAIGEVDGPRSWAFGSLRRASGRDVEPHNTEVLPGSTSGNLIRSAWKAQWRFERVWSQVLVHGAPGTLGRRPSPGLTSVARIQSAFDENYKRPARTPAPPDTPRCACWSHYRRGRRRGVGGFKSGAAPIRSAAVRPMPAFASTWLAKEWGHREARVTGAYRGHHAPHRRNTSQSTVLRMLAMKAHVVCVRSTRYVSRAVVVRHRPRPRHVVMEQKRAVIPWRSWEDQRGDIVR